MNSYEKVNKPANAAARQLAAGKNAIQLQDNRPKTVVQQKTSGGVVQRKGNNIVQRVISIGGQPTSVEETYGQMVKKDPQYEEDKSALTQGILPAYRANGATFANIDHAITDINMILKTYNSLFYSDRYKDNFAGYLHNQMISQAAVKAAPGNYRSMLTTAGFEHEFADMKNSPLSGVSHLEVAESSTSLPFTGIKFLVETDASNALELVSPPFLFPTTNGSTVPRSDLVGDADTLMKSSLYEILTEKISSLLPDSYYSRIYINQTLDQLLQKLSAKTGFTFHLKNNIDIKPEYLSHNTDLNVLKDHVISYPQKLILNQNSLKNISVGKSDKGKGESYSISSQVNFATDAATAGKLQYNSNEKGADIFKTIDKRLRTYIPPPAPGSTGLAGFYTILISKLAGLFAIYSQEHVRSGQQELYKDLVAKATPLAADRNSGIATSAEFELHTSLLSFVKDATPAWIKDHIISLAKGLLAPADYPKLLTALQQANVSAFALPVDIDQYLQKEGHATTAAHWAEFIKEIKGAIIKLIIIIKDLIIPTGSASFIDANPNVGLYEHNPVFIGARQDTYLDPTKIQLPAIHPGKRLHVTETRRGNPADKLKELEKNI